MKTLPSLLLLLLAVVLAAGCATQGPKDPKLPARTLHLEDDYGTISFSAVVHRSSTQQSYVFHIESLKLTFHPDARTNRVERAHLRLLTLVASQAPAEEGGKYKILSSLKQPITAVLDRENPTAEFSDITFSLPKHIVAQADHVGIAVTDGRLLWPLPGELHEP